MIIETANQVKFLWATCPQCNASCLAQHCVKGVEGSDIEGFLCCPYCRSRNAAAGDSVMKIEEVVYEEPISGLIGYV